MQHANLKLIFIIFMIIIFQAQPVLCAERTYYSIHIASFKNLENANRMLNSIKKKGKMVFWEKTNVPQKGEYYRVYTGKYKNRAEAVAFWKKLKKDGAVSYFGIYEFKETIETEVSVLAPDLKKPEQPLAKQRVLPSLPEKRFVDNQDGTVTDTQTNLMWIKNGWRFEFVSAVSWQEALQKCKKFNLGGYTNWRLSTIKEWKSLIDQNKKAPALVEPSPFENIIVHMPYWSKTDFVIGKDYFANKGKSTRAYTVMLYSGNIIHQRKDDRAFIMPVRSIE